MRRWLIDNKGYRDIWLVLTTGLALWAVMLTFSVSDQNRESLCALRADLQARVDGGVKFLAQHPHGAFGFKPREIRDSITNQQRTVQALRGLDCK